MRMIKFLQISALTACGAFILIGCIAAQNAQTMNDNASKSNRETNANSLPTNGGQTVSGSINSNASNLTDGGLTKYKDKSLKTVPTKAVSPKFVIEHRTALDGKTVTVSGIVVSVASGNTQTPSDDSITGAKPMANPQPRIFIADSSKNSRNKNLDLMIIVETGDEFIVGQKATVKVRVESSPVAVVLRKVL